MKNYPAEIEKKIGFDVIRGRLIANCLGPLGQQLVNKMQTTSEPKLLERLLYQAREFQAILKQGVSFPESNYLDVSELLKKASVEGAFLEEEECYELKISLTTIFKCLEFFFQHREEYPCLHQAVEGVVLEKHVLEQIEAVINEKGHIRDNASTTLLKIRKEIVSSQTKARKTIGSIMKRAQSDGFAPDDAGLTIRGGRLVIPVIAEYKRRITGFVHDESSTGQTVYVEPAEVLEINNQVKELEYQERREVVRILTALTHDIRKHIPDLERAYRFLGIVDFIRAKGKLSLEFDCVLPAFEKGPALEWYQARHPILELSLKAQSKKVVPLTIQLDPENRILLISGPNAGGKSVCLKTVGLLQYMFQCGLLVPVAETSKLGIFRQLFIDIGDEQSIENDLSTYSSHLNNMREFLERMNGKTLFLIDEFGTGTEPQFGGAIAEAILKNLNHKKGFGVATTHYANLKKLAEKTRGIINGAMRYDIEKLEPLYELEIGKPGSSFALEIASKIGLRKEIIEHAKKLVGHSHVRFDELISSLEQEKNKYKEQYEKIASKDEQLTKVMKEYSELRDMIEVERKRLVKHAKIEAKQIIEGANKKVEATIREIKEQKAEKKATKKLREELEAYKEKMVVEEKPSRSGRDQGKRISTGKIKVGSKVSIAGQNGYGEVAAIKGKKAEVNFGVFKSIVGLDQLVLASQVSVSEKGKQTKQPTGGIDLNKKMAGFSSNLDLRGKRAEEAIFEIEKFVDQAILLGYNQLRIVHGKGHGVLRELIRGQLKGNPAIAQMSDEHIERGGSGVTVITLKE